MTHETAGVVTPQRQFAPQHAWDRNFFLVMMLVLWIGILMGFGGDIAHHYAKSGLNYPLIVHFHAAAFVGWLILLTTQILLIRNRNYALHRKLGAVGAVLAVSMVVLGPATQLTADRLQYGSPDSDPAFMSIAFTGIFLFGVLVCAAIVLRNNASAHKRLILLATIAISNAGFTRWLGPVLAHLFGRSQLAFWGVLYLIPTVLVAAIGVFDLVTRRRLVPAYVAGAVFCIVVQVLSIWLYFSPAWLAVTRGLTGH